MNDNQRSEWQPAAGAQAPAIGSSAPTTEAPARAVRGFAAMDPSRQREIASRGGRASHAKKRGHEWSTEEARAAGRKGGMASRGGRGRAVTPAGSDPTGSSGG